MISGDSLRFPDDFQHNASQKHPKATKSIPKQPKSAKATGSIGEGGGWSPSWLSWEALWPKGFSNHWFSLSWETYLGGVFLNSTKLRNPFWGGVSQLGSLLAKSCGTAVPQLLCWQKVVALQCHSFTKTHQDTPRHTKTHQDTPSWSWEETCAVVLLNSIKLRSTIGYCASQLQSLGLRSTTTKVSSQLMELRSTTAKVSSQLCGSPELRRTVWRTILLNSLSPSAFWSWENLLLEFLLNSLNPSASLELRRPFAMFSSQLHEGVSWCVLVCLGVCWCVLVCLGVSWSATGSAIGSDKQIFYMGCCGTCAFRSWERHCPQDLPLNAQTSFSTPRLPSQPSNLLLNSQTSFSTPRLPSQLLELLRVPAFQLHAIIWYNMCYTMCYIFDIPRPKVPPQLRPIIP